MTKTFELRDIVEVVEQYVDLTEKRGTADKPYYLGLCPMHDDKTVGSFIVYASVQKVTCYSCCGGDYLDAIEFVKRVEGITYEEARAKVGYELSAVDALNRHIKKQPVTDLHLDTTVYSSRASKLFEIFNFKEALTIIQKMDEELENGRWVAASQLLTAAGV